MYPAPESSYMPDNEAFEHGTLMYIKKRPIQTTTGETKEGFIPNLLIRYDGRFGGSSKILVFFHGNAEDIGLAEDLLLHLSEALEVHVLAVEYPGYGIYRDESTDPESIEEDALAVYEYLTDDFGIKEQDIILFGRSLGSAPASYLAAKKNPGMLVLMSPFTSIKDAAGSLIGRWVKFAVSDIHRNKDHMESIDCPTYILHGELDTLIPYAHSEELASKLKGVTDLRIPPMMDHNNFEFYDDLVQPLISFMIKNNILVHPTEEYSYKLAELEFPEEAFEPPKWYKDERNQKKMQTKSAVRNIATKFQNQ